MKFKHIALTLCLCSTPALAQAGMMAWIEEPLAMHECESKLSQFSHNTHSIHQACQCAWSDIDNTPHEKTALLKRLESKKHDPKWHNIEVTQAMSCIKSSGLYSSFIKERKENTGKGKFRWFRLESTKQAE